MSALDSDIITKVNYSVGFLALKYKEENYYGNNF